MLETITLRVAVHGDGYRIEADTEDGLRTWSWHRDLQVVAGKAEVLARAISRRTNRPVLVVNP